jgi:hypothetical protein
MILNATKYKKIIRRAIARKSFVRFLGLKIADVVKYMSVIRLM